MTTQQLEHAKSHTWNEIQSQGSVWQTVLEELSASKTFTETVRSGAKSREWLFIGCGTSYYLAEVAAISWTLITGQAARAIPASEVQLFPKLVQAAGGGLEAVVISRSGRTSEAVRAAKILRNELKIDTVGITCASSSELEAACDACIVLRAADEQSTVMTRSFTSMLMTLQVLAAKRAGNSGFVEELRAMAEAFSPRISGIAEQMEAFVAKHSFEDYVFLGQGPFHGIAREAALKVMEMSCSYSQFFHALEFRHGPKAIVNPGTCLTFFLSDTAQEAETEVLEEMRELGGVIIAVCNSATAEIRHAAHLVIELNASSNELARLTASIVPCQLFGYFSGLAKGLNPDSPKNLTRVVILE